MAKRSKLTSKDLQALLTRIGSASSGIKSTLAERFQRDLRKVYKSHPPPPNAAARSAECGRKMRVVSIDMGIKNLAFCDAEIAYPASTSAAKRSLDANMKVLRWKKLDLVGGVEPVKRALNGRSTLQDNVDDGPAAEENTQFSPSVLSKTAYKLITEEILRANPDVILIEKQRWRSGGGSAVQQWTVRVNTLEAMLWAILETLKSTRHEDGTALVSAALDVRAVDPKRVGQYWLGQHARVRDGEAGAREMPALAVGGDELGEAGVKATKKISRSKAEKSAKIAILRSWLARDEMSTAPSTPSYMPRITFSIDPSAEATRQALLPKAKGAQKKRASRSKRVPGADAELAEELPAAEIKKLDDITDCFLQAAAWVAWESNKLQLLAALDSSEMDASSPIDEAGIVKMIEQVDGA